MTKSGSWSLCEGSLESGRDELQHRRTHVFVLPFWQVGQSCNNSKSGTWERLQMMDSASAARHFDGCELAEGDRARLHSTAMHPSSLAGRNLRDMVCRSEAAWEVVYLDVYM